MSQAADHHRINYLEVPTNNIAASKAFFTHVFNWTFADYGGRELAVGGA
jgi:predicted enzyme related to lactoylglutathione lyase